MQEYIDIYDLDGHYLQTKERSAFYNEAKDEFTRTGRIQRQVKSVRVLLLRPDGRIFVQKRSPTKEENGGIYDKSVGGHVSSGQSWGNTVVRECAEELGINVSVLPDDKFNEAKHTYDLSAKGIVKKIDFISGFHSVRIKKNGERILQPFMTAIYLGYYDGPVHPDVEESVDVKAYSLPQLKKAIEDDPQQFTEDLKYLISKYDNYIQPLAES